MKKFFCVALFCASLFARAMDSSTVDPRETDDKYNIPRRSSSDLRLNVLRRVASSSSVQPITRSPRLNTSDDKNNVVPNLNAEQKK